LVVLVEPVVKVVLGDTVVPWAGAVSSSGPTDLVGVAALMVVQVLRATEATEAKEATVALEGVEATGVGGAAAVCSLPADR